MARPISTYSIVAADLEAGQWGVAVQSKFLSVGSVVPWAEPHVGAVATQAYANPRYGPDGLALLRQGLSAEEVVRRLTEADDGRDQRQLGVVDAAGRGATFTGSGCHDWAGGRTGSGYSAQGTTEPTARNFDCTATPHCPASRSHATIEYVEIGLAIRGLDEVDCEQLLRRHEYAGYFRAGQCRQHLLLGVGTNDDRRAFLVGGAQLRVVELV